MSTPYDGDPRRRPRADMPQQASPGQPYPQQPYPPQQYPQPYGAGELRGPVPMRPAAPMDLLDSAGRKIYRLPAVPVDYQHMLRGRGYRAWKPVLSVVLLLGLALVSQVFAGMLLAVWLLVSGDVGAMDAVMDLDVNNPWIFALLMLSLVLFIPLSMLAVRLIHGVSPGYLSSVTGRFRWGWAATVAAVLLPLWVVYIGVLLAIDGSLALSPADNWPIMVALIVLLVPFQAAGEEYAFRGFLLQAVGSWFANRWVALVVPTLLSIVLFALAHGSLDPGILLDLGLFAALAVYLTWRTGGLEAAIVMHAVNNVTIMLFDTAAGNLNRGIVGEETSQDVLLVLPSLVVNLVVAGIVTLLARKRGVQRMFEPVPVPPPAHAQVAPGPAGPAQYLGQHPTPAGQAAQPDAVGGRDAHRS